MIIDMHTHIFLKDSFKEAIKSHLTPIPQITNGPRGKLFLSIAGETFGPIEEQLYDLEKRIDAMNKESVDMQVLSIVPFTFFYDLDPLRGMAFARAQNDAIAEVVKEHPDRFVGAACVPLQDINGALEELDRAIVDHEMKTLVIGSNIRNKNLDSLELWPFYERVQELDVPIIVHPINPSNAERMQKYYLVNLIGYPMETSLAIASIIFGGVLEEFPKLKFCFVHAGGGIPYQIGRLRHGYQERSEARTSISRPPSKYMNLMYFDSITHYPPALKYLIATVGSDKVLMGSDFPYDMGDPHPVSSIRKLMLSNENEKRILGKNAANLLKICVGAHQLTN